MTMMATLWLTTMSAALPELLAQEGVTRVAARSGSGMVIDIIIVIAFVCAALFGICRSSLRR